MTVRAGREFLAIPGPTTVPDEVLRAMHRPAVDIYSGPLVQLTDSLLSDLSRLFRTEGRSYIYIANGHGAWECVIENLTAPGQTVLVPKLAQPLSGSVADRAAMRSGDWVRSVAQADESPVAIHGLEQLLEVWTRALEQQVRAVNPTPPAVPPIGQPPAQEPSSGGQPPPGPPPAPRESRCPP